MSTDLFLSTFFIFLTFGVEVEAELDSSDLDILITLHRQLKATIDIIHSKVIEVKDMKDITKDDKKMLDGHFNWKDLFRSLGSIIRTKRGVIKTCFHLMQHLNEVLKLLEEGIEEQGAYNVSSINSILEEVHHEVETVNCNEKEQNFVNHQLVKLAVEMQKLETFLNETEDNHELNVQANSSSTFNATEKSAKKNVETEAKVNPEENSSNSTTLENPSAENETLKDDATTKATFKAKNNSSDASAVEKIQEPLYIDGTYPNESKEEMKVGFGLFLALTMILALVDIICVVWCLLTKKIINQKS